MSYIKKFDYKLAFIGPTDKLSDKDIPNNALKVDENLEERR